MILFENYSRNDPTTEEEGIKLLEWLEKPQGLISTAICVPALLLLQDSKINSYTLFG